MGPQSYGQTKWRCQKLQERVGDYVIKVHCVAHNLELAVVDVLTKEKKQAMAEVETTLKYQYHQSPKLRRGLTDIPKCAR